MQNVLRMPDHREKEEIVELLREYVISEILYDLWWQPSLLHLMCLKKKKTVKPPVTASDLLAHPQFTDVELCFIKRHLVPSVLSVPTKMLNDIHYFLLLYVLRNILFFAPANHMIHFHT